MQRCFVVATVLLCGVAVGAQADRPPRNPLLQSLLQRGVDLGNGQWVKLPAPTLDDGLDPAAQRALVDRVAGRHGWQRFVRPSAVAPFALRLSYLTDDAARRIGHSVSLWFVAHGNLAALADERLASRLFAARDPNNGRFAASARELDDAELARHGIRRGTGNGPQFVYAELPLMERVFICGVGHAVSCRSAESLVVAWQLDDRFAAAGELANRWYPIETDALGNRTRGTEHRYQGYGGYAKVTQLAEPAGALLVEAHVVFHEPEAWFGGSNLIRSKMPLAVQDSVRRFRRQLQQADRPPRDPRGAADG